MNPAFVSRRAARGAGPGDRRRLRRLVHPRRRAVLHQARAAVPPGGPRPRRRAGRGRRPGRRRADARRLDRVPLRARCSPTGAPLRPPSTTGAGTAPAPLLRRPCELPRPTSLRSASARRRSSWSTATTPSCWTPLGTSMASLTATVHFEPDDDDWAAPLLDALAERTGRVVVNGWPTGVAVSPAMHHGGPWPATHAPLHSSVGGNAITRFLRPVSLPERPRQRCCRAALQDSQPARHRRCRRHRRSLPHEDQQDHHPCGGHAVARPDLRPGPHRRGRSPASARPACSATPRRLLGYLAEAEHRTTSSGSDPFDIESLVHRMKFGDYGRSGEIVMSGIACVEMACWDIVGKALGQPVWRLLGGKVRDKIKAYANGWYTVERTPEEFHAAARTRRRARLPGPQARSVRPGSLRARPRRAACARSPSSKPCATPSAPPTELLVEMHGRFAPHEALRIAKLVEPFDPSLDRGAGAAGQPRLAGQGGRGARRCRSRPGERIHDRTEFRELFELQAADIIQPDIGHIGGILETREARRDGRDPPRARRAAQRRRPGPHRGQPPPRRLHPELQDPGVLQRLRRRRDQRRSPPVCPRSSTATSPCPTAPASASRSTSTTWPSTRPPAPTSTSSPTAGSTAAAMAHRVREPSGRPRSLRGEIAVRDRATPVAGPGEVLVRVAWAGICGSDVDLLRGRRPAPFARYPIVPGHEWSGTVEAIGARRRRGVCWPRLVVGENIRPCGTCDPCRRGDVPSCEAGYEETGLHDRRRLGRPLRRAGRAPAPAGEPAPTSVGRGRHRTRGLRGRRHRPGRPRARPAGRGGRRRHDRPAVHAAGSSGRGGRGRHRSPGLEGRGRRAVRRHDPRESGRRGPAAPRPGRRLRGRRARGGAPRSPSRWSAGADGWSCAASPRATMPWRRSTS